MTGEALFDVGSSSSSSPVHAAYGKAIAELRTKGVLTAAHEGLAENLLRLGSIIDTERKGYAVAQATAQAHDIMKTLLGLVPSSTEDDPFLAVMRDLESKMPTFPRPSS